jgi:hypothetical protein
MRLQKFKLLVLFLLMLLVPSCVLDSTVNCGEDVVCGPGGSGGTGGSGGQTGPGGAGGTGTAGSGGQGGQPAGGNGGTGGIGGDGGGGAGPICGNDTKEVGEDCDGTDLDNQDCGSVPGGYTSGTLSCALDCTLNTSDCVPPPPTCLAGTTSGTVDTITASGAIETGFLLHHSDGTEFYSNLVPTMYTFTNEDLPGQLALFGKDGVQFDLQNGLNPIAMPYYLVDDLSTLPSPECDGVALKSQACLSLVAKSFRCQFSPYDEAFGCPSPVSFMEPMESPSDFYQDLTAGYHILLVDLVCP